MVNTRSNDETADVFFMTLFDACLPLVTLDYTEDTAFQPHDQMNITADQAGLQRLSISVRDSSYIPIDIVTDLVLANAPTLEDLRICEYDCDSLWNSLNSSEVQLPLLQTLHIMLVYISDTALEDVYHILQRCPTLSTLVWRANVDERKMLQDLSIHCPHLTQLTLSLPPDIDLLDHDKWIHLQDENDQGLVQLPRLTHLHLPYAFALDDHFLLNRIPVLENLTFFTIGYSDSNITAHALVKFLSSRVPQAEVVALTFLQVFDDEAAQVLVECRPSSLRLLKLKFCHQITDEGVQNFLDADVNVETSDCYGLSEDMVNALPEVIDECFQWNDHSHKW
ncbi:hypothetical protein BCR43DRAFT_503379 [Syncephalastrum racemosum]|uniref:F-box domain-containing protein n=1 Tax=Syncephalastrum racemosum TaxID=13706 RepID=A0A1X2HHP2_SYNRA|nr:hypothetical protein BCR43DRAFT_503379 [Syncephalastrum racemosum]